MELSDARSRVAAGSGPQPAEVAVGAGQESTASRTIIDQWGTQAHPGNSEALVSLHRTAELHSMSGNPMEMSMRLTRATDPTTVAEGFVPRPSFRNVGRFVVHRDERGGSCEQLDGGGRDYR
ncbi:MAG TPA: hypothetical protein VKE74_00235 [Gemmataceae bacterium]|nr:hypothetical protein [Gemmataceae bacterium]